MSLARSLTARDSMTLTSLTRGAVAGVVEQIRRFLDLGDDAVGRFLVDILYELVGRFAPLIVGMIDGREYRHLGCQHHRRVVPVQQMAQGRRWVENRTGRGRRYIGPPECPGESFCVVSGTEWTPFS